MFDVTAELVNNQEEIHGLDKILVETVINLQRAKVYVFSDCVVSWKDPSTSAVQRSLERQDRMDHN